MQLVKVSFLLVTSIVFLGGSIKSAYGTAYSSEDQKTILEAHNYYRSKVSPTAINMDEMVSFNVLNDFICGHSYQYFHN